MEYGAKFDQELEKLLWEFLLRLDRLLPVPNLAQVLEGFGAVHVEDFAGPIEIKFFFFFFSQTSLRLCHG